MGCLFLGSLPDGAAGMAKMSIGMRIRRDHLENWGKFPETWEFSLGGGCCDTTPQSHGMPGIPWNSMGLAAGLGMRRLGSDSRSSRGFMDRESHSQQPKKKKKKVGSRIPEPPGKIPAGIPEFQGLLPVAVPIWRALPSQMVAPDPIPAREHRERGAPSRCSP